LKTVFRARSNFHQASYSPAPPMNDVRELLFIFPLGKSALQLTAHGMLYSVRRSETWLARGRSQRQGITLALAGIVTEISVGLSHSSLCSTFAMAVLGPDRSRHVVKKGPSPDRPFFVFVQ